MARSGGNISEAALADSALADGLLASYRRAVEAVAAASAEIRRAARLLADRWERGGRCVYLGAGASGLVAAEDAAELPGTFGLDPKRIAIVIAGGTGHPFQIDAAAEDDAAAAAREIEALGDLARDAVVAVSASGSSPFTLSGAVAARRRGAVVIGFANRIEAPLLREASAPILLNSGEEALQGSTRLAAGVAQKGALGMLSTLLGLELGHICRGLMVNLRADNDKLRRRAIGIVETLAGADEDCAQVALRTADGNVKQAILIAAGARGREDADELLHAAWGRIDAALERLADRRSEASGSY
jgi:N-acetylmuramic acid 6-phosphate etherase